MTEIFMWADVKVLFFNEKENTNFLAIFKCGLKTMF